MITDNIKDATLKLRLSEDMRKHIEKQAELIQVSMSEYLRILIFADMKCVSKNFSK